MRTRFFAPDGGELTGAPPGPEQPDLVYVQDPLRFAADVLHSNDPLGRSYLRWFGAGRVWIENLAGLVRDAPVPDPIARLDPRHVVPRSGHVYCVAVNWRQPRLGTVLRDGIEGLLAGGASGVLLHDAPWLSRILRGIRRWLDSDHTGTELAVVPAESWRGVEYVRRGLAHSAVLTDWSDALLLALLAGSAQPLYDAARRLPAEPLPAGSTLYAAPNRLDAVVRHATLMGDRRIARLALASVLGLPGIVPVLRWGDEIGMTGLYRSPMPWSDDQRGGCEAVAKQARNPRSELRVARALNLARARLGLGNAVPMTPLPASSPTVFAACSGERLVASNVANRRRRFAVMLREHAGATVVDDVGDPTARVPQGPREVARVDGRGRLEYALPAYGFAWLRLVP